MKVFLSWSGSDSHKIAEALHSWIPAVIQSAQPWISSEDVVAGTRWSNEIAFQLKESKFGIICLTPENINAPWLLYEAGALTKELQSSYVVPYLFGFSPSELTGPLIQLQAITATKDGTKALVKAMNRSLGENSLADKILDQAFEAWWPSLEEKLSKIIVDAETQKSIIKEEAKKEATIQEEGLEEKILKIVSKLYGPPPSDDEVTQVISGSENKVFIVHGHDDAAKEAVARYIEKLDLVPIILHEQPNQGRTVIEKFESFSQSDYAVVLFTADDKGGSKVEGYESYQYRARQNVIFELGFFTAKLGRSRICVLYEEGVEIPSDISGIIYIPLDPHGAWKFQIAKELKLAGMQIDLNKAL